MKQPESQVQFSFTPRKAGESVVVKLDPARSKQVKEVARVEECSVAEANKQLVAAGYVLWLARKNNGAQPPAGSPLPTPPKS